MISTDAIEEIKKRALKLNEIIHSDTNERISKISKELEHLSDEDDAYYLGHLYAILIDSYLKTDNHQLKEEKSRTIILCLNKIMLLSGMDLYGFCGNYSPFTENKINKIIPLYEAEEKKENYADIWGRGRLLQLQNRYVDAISFYKKIIEKDSKNDNAYRMCARVYEEIDDYDNANLYLKKALTLNDDPLTQCMLATAEVKQYNYKKAEKILTDILKRNPNYHIAKYRLNYVLRRLDKIQESYENRNQLLIEDPLNIKHILYTVKDYTEDIKKELDQITDAVKHGYDYTPVKYFLGNYFFEKKNYNKAFKYYNQAIENNKYHSFSYLCIIDILSQNLFKKNDNTKKKKLINRYCKLFPYYIVTCFDLQYKGYPLDIQIEQLEKKIGNYPQILNLYYLLLKAYLKKIKKICYNQEEVKQYQRKISSLCEYISKNFRSLYAYYLCYFYYSESDPENYDKIELFLNKCIKNTEENIDLKILAEQLKYYKNPDQYNTLINESKKTIGNLLDDDFYGPLIGFYFDKCFLTKQTDYSQYCLKLIESSVKKNLPITSANEFRFIRALLLRHSQQYENAKRIYEKVELENLPLSSQISICGDVFDINILHALYSHQTEEIPTADVEFWTYLLLYLLQFDLFQDQEYRVSHYTSVAALEAMLSDQNMSPFRLCSLGSANDSKEGKILYDFLGEDLNLKDYLQVINTPLDKYTAVQASFTKLEDALTMFRLYGKNDNMEGTGVNLVFNENFFTEDFIQPLRSQDIKSKRHENDENPYTPPNFEKIEKIPKEPLYWILYWDKKNNKIYFNPQGIYKTLEIDLNIDCEWSVLNKNQKELKESPDLFYRKYANNIAFTLNRLKESFKDFILSDYKNEDIKIVKKTLLNISYLIKDIAFYDEKELRIVNVEEIHENDELKHDEGHYRLYKNYLQLNDSNTNENCLEKIIIGPKVPQKETLKEYLIQHLAKANMNYVEVEISEAPLA